MEEWWQSSHWEGCSIPNMQTTAVYLVISDCVHMDFSIPVTSLIPAMIMFWYGAYMHTEKPRYEYPCIHDKYCYPGFWLLQLICVDV